MNWLKTNGPFYVLGIFAIWVFILSIFDIIYDKDWMAVLLALYAIILIIVLYIILTRSQKEKPTIDTIEEFEKTLKGGLYHFKCPICLGFFAVKKSKSNDKKPVSDVEEQKSNKSSAAIRERIERLKKAFRPTWLFEQINGPEKNSTKKR